MYAIYNACQKHECNEWYVMCIQLLQRKLKLYVRLRKAERQRKNVYFFLTTVDCFQYLYLNLVMVNVP